MPLLEHQAQRFAVALDDYDNVSVTDIGGSDDSGFWLVIHDHSFDLDCEISSRCDYWDFIVRHAVGRPAGAATCAAGATS